MQRCDLVQATAQDDPASFAELLSIADAPRRWTGPAPGAALGCRDLRTIFFIEVRKQAHGYDSARGSVAAGWKVLCSRALTIWRSPPIAALSI